MFCDGVAEEEQLSAALALLDNAGDVQGFVSGLPVLRACATPMLETDTPKAASIASLHNQLIYPIEGSFICSYLGMSCFVSIPLKSTAKDADEKRGSRSS